MPVVFHGHGIGDEVDRVLQERFLRKVDEGLWEVLREERAPLVLAGVGHLCAIFREVTRYANVLDQGIEGNPGDLRPRCSTSTPGWIVEPGSRGAWRMRTPATGSGPGAGGVRPTTSVRPSWRRTTAGSSPSDVGGGVRAPPGPGAGVRQARGGLLY